MTTTRTTGPVAVITNLRPIPHPVAPTTTTVRPFNWADDDIDEDITERTVTITCSPLEASLLIQGCSAAHDKRPSRAWVDLAELVRAAHRTRRRPQDDPDPTPAHGTPRPR